MSWILLFSGIVFTGASIATKQPEIANIIAMTWIPSAIGLYINKQWTEYKTIKTGGNSES